MKSPHYLLLTQSPRSVKRLRVCAVGTLGVASVIRRQFGFQRNATGHAETGGQRLWEPLIEIVE